MSTSAPLTGLRVLDCTRLLPCSYGTQLLTDLGASVVKVEPPGGEYGREMRREFAMSNRGKESVELDLTSTDGAERFRALVRDADVVIESFRPGVMDSLGVGYEALSAVNPSIIMCSSTGYGQHGPNRDTPGHDLNYLALAGAAKPYPDWPPVISPLPAADMATGIMCAFLISAAYVEQRRTGRGTHIDLSMADLSLSMNVLSIARAAPDDPAGTSTGARLSGLPWPDLPYGACPCYAIYAASDDRLLSFGNVEPKFWRNFVAAIDRPDLEADRLATGSRAKTVKAEIQEIIGRHDRAYWLRHFDGLEICVAPVNTAAEALTDPTFTTRGMVWTDDAGTVQLSFPATLAGIRPGTTGRAPHVGENTLPPVDPKGADQ